MSQVSKRPISRELAERMNEILWGALAKLGKKPEVASFLEDILTRTERVMVAKRLAIGLLLSRGWDQESVSYYLKVSTATVQAVKRIFNSSRGGLLATIRLVESMTEWEQIKLDLTQAFEEILAGRVGVNWKESKPAVKLKYAAKRRKYKVL